MKAQTAEPQEVRGAGLAAPAPPPDDGGGDGRTAITAAAAAATAAEVTGERPVRDLAAAAPYLADWQEFRRQVPAGEPARIAELRQAAIERFGGLGFPTVRQEEWRFTNLGALARAAFRRPAVAGAAGAMTPDIAPWIFDAAARLVFVDGRWAPQLSALTAEGLPAGTVVTSVAEALVRHPQAVEPWLGCHTSFENQPFAALNTAFLQDGAVVVLPRGAVLAGPIHLLYLSTPGTAAAAVAKGSEPGVGAAAPVSYPRNLIVAGEGSQLTVVETYVGDGAYFSCGVTEIIAGPASVIDHYKVQRESREAYHLATLQIYAERGSNVSSHSISLGGGLVRNDVNAYLGGEGIECTLNGLYLADGRQLVDNHMRVEHAMPHCASHELYKGILDGKARSVFNGLIHVHPGAQKTDAKQSNRNLLLSADAIANSNPQLEIFADDVRCTHGSTVGQLDDDAVFYLRSRGIGAAAARSILTYAFASDIVERIKVDKVRRDLEEYLFARLPQGEVVRQAV
jgi:Fe-S cluster assembly protein SufD